MEKGKIIQKLIKRVKIADVEPDEYLIIFSLSLSLLVLQCCHSAKKSLGHTQELLGQHTRRPSWQLFITHTRDQASQKPSRYTTKLYDISICPCGNDVNIYFGIVQLSRLSFYVTFHKQNEIKKRGGYWNGACCCQCRLARSPNLPPHTQIHTKHIGAYNRAEIEIKTERIQTYFSLAWASEGTVDPLPFAYIVVSIFVVFATLGARPARLTHAHHSRLAK